MARRLGWFGILVLCLGLFGCDHATKLAAHAVLAGGRTVAVVPHVELLYAENHDTAFSLLRTFHVARDPRMLVAASLIALVGVLIAWLRARGRASRIENVGWALVFSGALGNVVDRAVRGFVVDFIHVSHWPVFNVADIAVVIGVASLFAARWRRKATASEG